MSVPVDNFRLSAKATRKYRILWGKTLHKTIKGGSRSGGCARTATRPQGGGPGQATLYIGALHSHYGIDHQNEQFAIFHLLMGGSKTPPHSLLGQATKPHLPP
ncbi:hypothetical protein BHF81_04930 [Corynebacterium diphtheriae]|nr:hypothetical protein BHF76_07635 [Corynebacterium diphtheriae]OIR81380.1 hypothetical protein BHF81_04930 [Corynebacterium diphtheriae]OIR85058.1 hypothetical protein BHF86_02375 [Corynebacterium diphtheriae]OIR88953.1 hypothetical protein BHF87_07995 [Corynebacterium diphtheriae]